MTKSKYDTKTSTLATELHEAAAPLIDAWREAIATHVTAQRRVVELDGRRGSHANSSEAVLKRTVARIAALEAEEDLSRKEAAASDALTMAEIAEGDELALGSDVRRVLAEFAALEQQERELAKALADVKAQAAALCVRGSESTAALQSRRSADNLPRLPGWPSPDPLGNGTPASLQRQALERRLEQGRPLKDRSQQLLQLRNEELETRAGIERARLAAEEERRDSEKLSAMRDRQREADNERTRAEHEARAAKARADREELERLANAQRAREAV